jgi:ABC-type multidrug transport system fused ATPase/permease subunit
MMSVCLLIGISLQLLNPQILRYFIDSATSHGPTEALLWSGLLFLATVLLNQCVAVATTYLSNYVAWTATNQIRADLVEHCLSLDMSFHKEHTAGEMIERIDGDVDALSNFFSQFVVHLLGNTLLLLGGLVLLFTMHWLAGLAMTIFSTIAMAILVYIRRRAMPLWLAQRQETAAFFGFLGERLSGTDDIRANGATGYSMRRFLLRLRQFAIIWRKAGMANHIMGLTTTFVFVCGNVLAVSVGIYLWNTGVITLGTVYAIYAYTNLLTQPIQHLQDQLQDWQQAEACIQRIEQLLHIPNKLIDGKGIPLPGHALSVNIEEVSFGYTDDIMVLHNMSFRLEPGKVLGVLGRTGSGKTTLARLLFRLYDPQQGEIRIGDVPLQHTKIRELRQHIGMVTQEVQLFNATVRDNLTFFKQTIPDSQVLAVIDEVGLSPWLQVLPEGLDTI